MTGRGGLSPRDRLVVATARCLGVRAASLRDVRAVVRSASRLGWVGALRTAEYVAHRGESLEHVATKCAIVILESLPATTWRTWRAIDGYVAEGIVRELARAWPERSRLRGGSTVL